MPAPDRSGAECPLPPAAARRAVILLALVAGSGRSCLGLSLGLGDGLLRPAALRRRGIVCGFRRRRFPGDRRLGDRCLGDGLDRNLGGWLSLLAAATLRLCLFLGGRGGFGR